MNMSKEKQRVIMKFQVKLGDGDGGILKRLRTVYGDGVLKTMAVYKWVVCYKEGQESHEDNPHSGRPVSAHTDENVKHADEVLAINHRISNCYIAETFRINRETTINNNGGSSYGKLCLCIVLKSLIVEQTTSASYCHRMIWAMRS